VLVLVAVVLAGLTRDVRGLWLYLPPLGLTLLTSLRAERPPRSWLWWVCLPSAYFLIPPADMTPIIAAPGVVLLAAFVLGSLAWAVIDARPAFAVAILLAFYGIMGMLTLNPAGLVYLAISAVAALPLLVRLVRCRRQVAL
jgi:hypothetical protein